MSIIRLGIICVCCAALLALDPSTGISQAQDELGVRTSRSSGKDKDSGKKTKKRFEELIADANLNNFRGYKEASIGDGWKFEGKYLVFDGSGGGDIITKETYTDFDLQFKWKISEGGNSGVMYRVSLGDNAPYFSGPEYQLLDDSKHADGKNKLTSSGSLYALYPPKEDRSKKAGQWNTSRIVVEGNKVIHYLNNKRVVEAEIGSDDWNEKVAGSKFAKWEKFGKNSSGHIAFQDHGNKVTFRDIRIKRLNDEAPAEKKATAAKTDDKPKRVVRGGGARRIGKKKIMSMPEGGIARGEGLLGAGNKKDDKDKDK